VVSNALKKRVDMLEPDKIYLVQRVGFPTYKIGRTSQRPIRRMRSIRDEVVREGLFNDGSPVELQLIHYFDVINPYEAEDHLHEYFSPHRIKFGPPCIIPEREWFTLNDVHIIFFKTLNGDNYLDLISIGKETDVWGRRRIGRAPT
jgi:hypothetical protein